MIFTVNTNVDDNLHLKKHKMTSVKEDGTMGADHSHEADIVVLKMKKTKAKTKFTRMENKFKDCIYDKTLSSDDLKRWERACKIT